jgi:thiamine pyrophosphokinase
MDLRILIFTNGNLDIFFTKEIQADDFIIGVDYAAYWLIKHHVVPDLAIGDFDSTNKNELVSIKHMCKNVVEYPRDKDFTDTELALTEAIKIKASEIIIFGATGNRMDHTLANIHLLETAAKPAIPCRIRDTRNEIRLVLDKLNIEKNNSFPYFSLLPVTDSVTVSITGAKYNLDHKRLDRGQTIGVSNEISGKSAEITVHSGSALVICSRD